MESPGKILQAERQRQRLSLLEVSQITRIKVQFLKAIEEDRYDLCPSPFYIKAFLTAYAKHLGLDPDEILSLYQASTPAIPHPVIKNPPLKPEGRTLRFKSRLPSHSTLRYLPMSIFLLFVFLPLYLYFHSTISDLPYSPPHPSATSQPSRIAMPTGEGNQEKVPMLQRIKPMHLIGPQEVQAEPIYRVIETRLGTGIETEGGRLAVVGKSSDFRCENQRVYFFTKIMSLQDGKIFHVWRLEGEEVHRTEMQVRSPSWSVYSYITLFPARSGNWKVEVWDQGKLLEEVHFRAL